MSTIAIDVRDLTKRYKGNILANDQLSLCVQRGEIFGLLGPNGAGKTTLVLQILGLLAPTSGRIVVEGEDVVAYPERIKALAGFMPQTRIAMRNLEVQRALQITGQLRGQSRDAARRRAASWSIMPRRRGKPSVMQMFSATVIQSMRPRS